jgi:hypothetical protein
MPKIKNDMNIQSGNSTNVDLLSLKSACDWATDYLGKKVSPANISYLINYGKILKIEKNGKIFVSKNELVAYYKSFNDRRENSFKDKLGEDLNWHLSFDSYTEAQTTKHVHRLHPYKGKFIPQLVEYFLDDKVDSFKKDAFFKKDDIVVDPFCGSGTTLVQANELGINAIGVDVSFFNSFISNCKIGRYDLNDLKNQASLITAELRKFLLDKSTVPFEDALSKELHQFNSLYFPNPDYKRRVLKGKINEQIYGQEKEREFLPIYNKLIKKYGVKLRQENLDSFLDKWYSKHVREEIDFVNDKIDQVINNETKNILRIVLSRTIRSCRATTHSDLATLIEPITSTYYCQKHGKICKPLFSIMKWWDTYTKDTIARIAAFSTLRTNTKQVCLTGDSRTIDLITEIRNINKDFAKQIMNKKIKGIFSSPPYVGLIDYHEQHAYAYDLFGFHRRDDLEIGPLFKGKGKEARESYVDGISKVLLNVKQFLVDDYDVFLVANDNNNLYPIIAERAGMTIVNQFKRPVLNRTEKDKNAYSETIFHLKRRG